MCEHEATRHTWRAEVLTFIRDHIDTDETYRLNRADLEFGELLPQAPPSVAQEEFEQRTRIGFALERLAKAGEGVASLTYSFLTRDEASRTEPAHVPIAPLDRP